MFEPWAFEWFVDCFDIAFDTYRRHDRASGSWILKMVRILFVPWHSFDFHPWVVEDGICFATRQDSFARRVPHAIRKCFECFRVVLEWHRSHDSYPNNRRWNPDGSSNHDTIWPTWNCTIEVPLADDR